MFDIALAVFLFLSPIILSPQIGNITALQFYQFGVIDSSNSFLQLQFFQFGAIILFIISLFCKKEREFQDKWLVLFLIGCLISVFLHPISVKVFPNIFLGFLLYKIVFEYAKNIKIILSPIIITSLLNCLFIAFQFVHFFPIYNNVPNICGLLKNSTHSGIYEALSFPIIYLFNPVLSIFPILGVLIINSQTAELGLIAGFMYLLRRKIKEMGSAWMMFTVSLIAILTVINKEWLINEFAARVWIWKYAIKNLTLFGHGLGNFKVFHTSLSFTFGQYDNPYNIYLGIIYAIGILSIPLFIWIYETIKNYVNFKSKDLFIIMLFTSCLMLLVMGLRSSFMDFPRLAGTAIILFSLLNVKLKGG